MLSNSPYIDAEDRERRRDRPPIDEVTVHEDGRHLTESVAAAARLLSEGPAGLPDPLRHRRPPGRREGQEGHRACSVYRMETKVGLVRCPTLVVCGTSDPFSYPRMEPLARAIAGSRSLPIPGGTVAMVDQMPAEFAAAILPFLRA